MTCNVEGCDRPVNNQKRGWCSLHYQRWYRTGSIGPTRTLCDVEGCTTRTNRGYARCSTHRAQDLVQNPNSNQHGRKYTDDMTCAFEACDIKPYAHYRCAAHYAQHKKYGRMWPVGQAVGRKEKMFSETMTCGTCGETKPWRLFVMGMDGNTNLCRDCYRQRLSRRVDLVPMGQGMKTRKKHTVEDVLAMLNRTK